MKNLQELFTEIIKSDELKTAFAQAAQTEEAVVAFAKAHGVDTTLDEIKAFLKSKTEDGDEALSPEDVDNVSGGCNGYTAAEAAFSVTVAFTCAIVAACSVMGASNGSHLVGSEDGENGGRLCSKKPS